MEAIKNKVMTIIDSKKRRLFNEIIYYYHKFGELIIADFITYLTMKTNVSDEFEVIVNKNL